MKRILIILISVFYCSSFNAQTVNGVPIEEIPVRFVNLVADQQGMNPYKLNIFLDYGQMTSLKDEKGYIIDKEGKRMTFVGMINALNFLDKKGFKLISTSLTYVPYSSTLFENTNYLKKLETTSK